MATNAKIETGDPALAIALCWFAVFYSAFMVGYWLWVEYFGIQRKVICFQNMSPVGTLEITIYRLFFVIAIYRVINIDRTFPLIHDVPTYAEIFFRKQSQLFEMKRAPSESRLRSGQCLTLSDDPGVILVHSIAFR